MKRATALTIAGSDSSGGAGIQADVKTMMANGVYAMSVISALTAQNTCGVRAIYEVDPGFLKEQLAAVFEDIFPDAVKIGMVSSPQEVAVIAEALQKYGAENIVLDPVMVSTSGSVLSGPATQQALWETLFPMASVITPNIPEAELISGEKICNKEDMQAVAKMIYAKYGCPVLVKGGHGIGTADDVLAYGGGVRLFSGERIANDNTHGTGCTLSSAIAANLAKGRPLEEAIAAAKTYISGALSAMLDLGRGSGPLDHGWNIPEA